MKTKLTEMLALHRQMSKLCEAIATEWSESERYRNDPLRQKLTTELCECLPRPTRLGNVVDGIALRLNIELD